MGPTIFKMRWMTETRIGRSQRRWVERHASRTFPRIILESIYSLNTHFAVVVQPLSCVRLLVTPWTAACQAPSLSLFPRVCSDSCPLSQWFYPTVSSFAALFSCLQSFPASGSFPLSQLFTSGGQSIGVSASVLVLPMNIEIFNSYLLSNYYVKYWSKPQGQKSDQSRWSLPASGTSRYSQGARIFKMFTANWVRISQFCAIKIWVQIILCSGRAWEAGRGAVPHCRLFTSIPDLQPLDASSITHVVSVVSNREYLQTRPREYLQTRPHVPWGDSRFRRKPLV